MNQKRNKTIYFIATGLLTVLLLFSAGMYFFNHEMVTESFKILGYPTYLVHPLAIAKILGLIVLWTRRSSALKEWAYAGFFFDFILALSAHLHVDDKDFLPALIAILLLFISYVFKKYRA